MRRSRWGAEYWRKHLEAWLQSDTTRVAYCTSHGLSLKSFYRWERKQKEAVAAAKSSLTLVPVNMGGAPSAGSVVRLRSPDGWEIELPGNSVPLLVDFLKHLS